MTSVQQADLPQTPFASTNPGDYADWRAWKLDNCVTDAAALTVDIDDPLSLQVPERENIVSLCAQHNMAIYQLTGKTQHGKQLVHALGRSLGLEHLDMNLRADEDSVTSLEVRPQQGNQYIPYTSKALSWHTDGYYNSKQHQIHGIIMHCVQPAASGGLNALLDPELVYIRLRDENPAYIDALMRQDAMTIPANEEAGREIRAAQAGPVFTVSAETGRLHMRYSARKRNIEWRADAVTQSARAAITDILQDDSIICRVGLRAGQGIVCNNVLHNRTAFEDSGEQKRLMYRARYFENIAC